MDNLDIAKALFQSDNVTNPNCMQTTTTYGVATAGSEDGKVVINLGGETASPDDEQAVEIDTTFPVKEGDEVIVNLVGADGTGKEPVVIGVVGRGDELQNQINNVTNYFWHDASGAHVSTIDHSVAGNNVLLDSDSLDIRYGNSDSEADQTVLASFGREVTVGSRAAGTVGEYSQVYGVDIVASGKYTHAEGKENTASGNYAHVEGYQNSVAGTYNHAEGSSNTIGSLSTGSHVEGYDNEIIRGELTHVEGGFNESHGPYVHIEGESNYANGRNIHVEGASNTVESGDSGGMWTLMHTHVEGHHCISESVNQHVQGRYNVSDAYNVYADIIGNGSYYDGAEHRSNAYNMDWNGNAEFKGEVYLGGCTPNGESPKPAVRYNSSLSRSEYYNGSSWVEVPGGGGGSSAVSITIAAGDWAGNTCTKSVSGVTASNNIIVAPDPSSYVDYCSAQIRATAQGAGTVTFACTTAPSGSVGVNVLIVG